jgi:hypothetical protein
VYVPVLRHLLDTAWLPGPDALIATGVGLAGWFAVRADRRMTPRVVVEK